MMFNAQNNLLNENMPPCLRHVTSAKLMIQCALALLYIEKEVSTLLGFMRLHGSALIPSQNQDAVLLLQAVARC